MNIVEKWILKRIAKRAVSHKGKMIEYYGFIVEAAREKNPKESKSTLDMYLISRHNDALKHRY